MKAGGRHARKTEPVNLGARHFDGIPVPFFQRTREEMQDKFKVRSESDIIVVTYKRSGTTWTMNILRHLLFPDDASDLFIDDKIPWINILPKYGGVEFEEVDSWPAPRVFKTHDPAEWIDDIVKGTNTKIIFIYRNAKDVSVSIYELMKRMKRTTATFQEFYKGQIRNPAKVTFGLWEEHLSGYLGQRDARNMLVLRYEDMKQDLPREIRKIADFINIDYTDEIIENVAMKTDFNYMKNDKTVKVWRGKVAGWEGYLTEEQVAELDEIERKVYEEHSVEVQPQTLDSECKDT